MGEVESLSTINLIKWPPLHAVILAWQSLSVLSAIQEDLETFRFSKGKSGRDHFQFRNGEGDHLEAWISGSKALLKGFAHECQMAFWDGYPWPDNNGDFLPDEFKNWFEDCLEGEEISFLVWHLNKDKSWNCYPLELRESRQGGEKIEDIDGSALLMKLIPLSADQYILTQKNYFDRELDFSLVSSLYQHKPLTKEMVLKINPNFNFERSRFLAAICDSGYPVSI